MLQKINDEVYKIACDSNMYYIKPLSLVIDTGNFQERAMVERELTSVVDPATIKTVIFTHLHYDHIGNFNMFPKAKFYAHKEEITYFEMNKEGAVLNPVIVKKFTPKLMSIARLKLPKRYQILHTPGHTCGSICILDTLKKILYSGDTLFYDGHGRVDLPSSEPKKMEKTLDLIGELDFETLCPGHDY
jgi:glyoxylase-like metal-dependent hydrolase (beta-lactamase superfamily II)